jgi:hypothetical protein
LEASAQGRFEFIHGLALMLKDNGRGSVPLLSMLEKHRFKMAKSTSSLQPMLILESLDCLIGPTNISAQAILALIRNARDVFSSVIVVIGADRFDSGRHQSLWNRSQSQLLSLLHQADFTLSVRQLGTGQATDVSGVLRLTIAHPVRDQELETEFLYHVDTKLSVRAWARGGQIPFR